MISLSIPAEVVPNSIKHTIETPMYSCGRFIRFSEVMYAPLTEEFLLDNKFDPDNFFITLSGNEFTKLVERDELPFWLSQQDVINYSTASCMLTELGKLKWVRR